MVSDVLSPVVVVHLVCCWTKCTFVCTFVLYVTSTRPAVNLLFCKFLVSLVKSKYKTQAMANAQSSVAARRTSTSSVSTAMGTTAQHCTGQE